MPTYNITGTVFTLSPSVSPVTLTCNVNGTGWAQSGLPYSLEGFANNKAQLAAGATVTLQLNTNTKTWIVTSGSFVVPPATQFISSIDNTATVELDVTAGVLTADFVSMLISQFTNDSNFISYADLSALAPMSFNSTTGEFSMTQADASTDGWLSSTDWQNFDSKEPALTKGNLTAAGTDGITVTNGTGAVIGSGTSIQQQAATGAQNGYLTSANFNTFNNKQATISVTAPITLSGASVGIVNQGTTTTVLHGNAAGNATFGAVDLAADVTGTLPAANGGNGNTLGSLVTLYFAGGLVSPADGDIIYIGPMTGGVTPLVGTPARRQGGFPYDGTIIGGYVSLLTGTAAPSGESSTFAIRINNTTDHTLTSSATFAAGVVTNTTTFTGLSIAITAGQQWEIKWTNPTYAGTNPANTTVNGMLYLRLD